jgi:hypothetical protein
VAGAGLVFGSDEASGLSANFAIGK